MVYCAHAQQAWMGWSTADRSFHHSTIPPFHRSIESRLPIVIANCTDQMLSVDTYGAIVNDSSAEAAVKNSQATSVISQALQNATQGSTVLVQKYFKYYIFSVYVAGLKHVQLRVEGSLIAISNITPWPVMDNDYQSVLYFPNCSDFTLTGPGTIVYSLASHMYTLQSQARLVQLMAKDTDGG